MVAIGGRVLYRHLELLVAHASGRHFPACSLAFSLLLQDASAGITSERQALSPFYLPRSLISLPLCFFPFIH